MANSGDYSSKLRTVAERFLQLIVAPASVTLLLAIATTPGLRSRIIVFSAVVVTILAVLFYGIAYSNFLEDQLEALASWLRARRFKYPRILILDGTVSGLEREIPAYGIHADRKPIDWVKPLEDLGRVKLGPVNHIDKMEIHIVINPFGEVYPEEDVSRHSSAYKLRDFVYSGGVYVNVSGNPFWYKFDTRVGKHETAGYVQSPFENQQPMWFSLMHSFFPGVQPEGGDAQKVESFQNQNELARFGDIQNAGGSRAVTAFRSYPINSPQIISMLRDFKEQHSLIAAYPYGEGFFLLCGLAIEGDNKSFEKVIAAITGWSLFEAKGRK